MCIHYADSCWINLDNEIFFNNIIEIILRDFFCFHNENRNEAAETHILRHQNPKTKNPRYRDSKIKKPRHRESKTKKPRHRDSKTFFQKTKSHDIEIPRLKNHDIEFLWNCDPYAPWYLFVVQVRVLGVLKNVIDILSTNMCVVWVPF